MQRSDISAWQKAAEIAQLQEYLRSTGHPHATRDLAALVDLPSTRIAEQLRIATELAPASLARYKVTPEDLAGVEHRALLRAAILPHYLREKPLRDLVRPEAVPATGFGRGIPTVRERLRSSIYEKLRDEGELLIDIPGPLPSLTAGEAREYLDEFLPALAHLAEIITGGQQTHYIGLTGNGGIVIYLSPVS